MKLASLSLLLAFAVAAQSVKRPDELALFFGNGLGLAFHTISSGSQTPLSMNGSVSTSGPNEAYRVVVDKNNRIVFAYLLHSEKTAAEMKVQLRPVDQAQLRQTDWSKYLSGDVPTIGATRDFPSLRLGDSVQVDIMYHPVTGEKISDVLRVITEDPQTGRRRVPDGDRFSFDRVKVVIDGKTVVEPRGTWMIGKAIKMQISGHGDYYLLLAPITDYPFKASGWVDHNVLRFKAGGESIEITGMTNLLQKAEFGTVWVHYVPESEIAKKTTSTNFVCAENMEQLKSAGSE